MNADQQALYDRIGEFQIDEDPAQLTFEGRLARENGWTAEYAERVVAEYKRFVFLAMAAGHPVTPSDQVDQAWHLHLTYTRSYWDRLCEQVLGARLHHGPTKGGNSEQEKFNDWYQATKDSYQRLFGESPPVEIWPAAETRFGEDLAFQRVNTQRNWIVPKVDWAAAGWTALSSAGRRLYTAARPAASSCLFGALALGLGAWNPLDFSASQFLTLYAVLFVACLILGVAARVFGSSRDEDSKPLSAEEAGCLAGGRARVLHAALADLLQQGVIEVVEQPKKLLGLTVGRSSVLAAVKPISHHATAVQAEVYGEVQASGSFDRVVRSGLSAARQVEHELMDRGLVEYRSVFRSLRWLTAGPMVLLLALGVTRLVIGLWRGEAVGFLIGCCVVTLIAAGILSARKYLTRAGRAKLAEYQARFAELKSDVAAAPALDAAGVSAGQPDVAMAAALFGLAVLPGAEMMMLDQSLKPHLTNHGFAGGMSGDGSGGGCGGDGGCGGGGCGGGGCGGCGGCGGWGG